MQSMKRTPRAAAIAPTQTTAAVPYDEKYADSVTDPNGFREVRVDKHIHTCIAVDRNEYLPTHNAKYSQMQTSDLLDPHRG